MSIEKLTSPSMKWTSKNLSEDWKRFEEHAKLMFQGPLTKTKDEERAAYILIWVGETGRDICNSWNITDAERKSPTTLFANFRTHTAPRKNKVFARYVFQERKQGQKETFDSFVIDLRNLVKDCEYPTPNEMVRDRIVGGISSQEVREKLLDEGDNLTMEKAIDIAVNYETTKKHLKSMASGDTGTSVDAIKKKATKKPHTGKRPGQQKNYQDQHSGPQINCKNCGRKHPPRKCPAFGEQCRKCLKWNHWGDVCLSSRKKVHTVEEGSDEDEENFLYLDEITGKETKNTAYANIELETGDSVKFKIDTGAQVNVLPTTVYRKLSNPPALAPAKDRLVGYSGKNLDVQGTVTLKTRYKEIEQSCTFHVVETHPTAQPILGLDSSLALNLIKLVLSVDNEETEPLTYESVTQEYSHLFDTLGDIDGEIDLHLQENAIPKVHPPRRVPIAIRERLKEELDKMEQDGVIKKVDEPTDWVNSLVIVEKPNGQLRICLDPKDLNNAIRRPHYPLPTLEDATAKMAGAKYFTKLDAKSGYWQLKLKESSSYLTTFNTPFGRYRFTRLPFGINCAQDEFQRKMDEIFGGIQGSTPLIDDIIVHGTSRAEHDQNLRTVLKQASEKKVTFNKGKLSVAAQEVSYFGHILTPDGLKPDPAKIKAINEMPPPKDKQELQTFLGMVTYLSKFSPNLSDATKPLRDLLKSDVDFTWDEQQNKAMEEVKSLISSQPILSFFDPKKEIILEVDASKSGLGATIKQEGKPVAFASKALTPTEENYAQIEKELYAILFGCQRFHQYLYGRDVTVHSDHKPLETIAKKPLCNAPPRLQRMLLQLQKYRIKVVYVPGKSIPIADTLSRKFLPAEADESTPDLDVQIHTIIKNLPVSDQKAGTIAKATKEDRKLNVLQTYIQAGWPNTRDQCHPDAAEFWTFRDELSQVQGLILKGESIFIPTALRPEMLVKIHEGHLGTEKCLQKARGVLFWPGMCLAIKDHISSCPICIPKAPSNPKEPLQSHPIPTRPWQYLASDIFTWESRNFLVTVDFYSRWFEIDELRSMTTAAVTRKLQVHFARHGIPESLLSDNGPAYDSEGFEVFTKLFDFRHETSSPGYPQSNGLAEKTVQTAKRMLSKCAADGTNFFLALLQYRTTPVDGLASPAELLMGRKLRSTLPSTQSHLQPKTIPPETVVQRRKECLASQKRYYDRGARPLPTHPVGEPVGVQLQKGDSWKPGKVIATGSTPRTLVVETKDGGRYLRNRRFVRKWPAQTTTPTPPAADQQPEASAPPTTSDPPRRTSGRTSKPPSRLDL